MSSPNASTLTKSEAANEPSSDTRIYHERQQLQLCLLHALNNLLQAKEFTRLELNEIADGLSKAGIEESSQFTSIVFKQHRNVITGNYDVNVLIAALESRGMDVMWYDRRKGSAGLDLSKYGEQLVGIIANYARRRYISLWKSRHWVALREIGGTWYNLDSDLAAPRPLCDLDEDLKNFVEMIFSNQGEVFIILDKDDSRNSSDGVKYSVN
ncbi:hypothetical protein O6H91_01G048700 [Diphasiastrum complanatum]|uniref:Uncharacterized protein n=1 Tax=Diphasiastrum complanatum TaxID=34168 RepID=A0ACC2EQK4_DIPCM|nr:hypothetical protein O6H91_01G048700 [Diphasiastrum complanatum]